MLNGNQTMKGFTMFKWMPVLKMSDLKSCLLLGLKVQTEGHYFSLQKWGHGEHSGAVGCSWQPLPPGCLRHLPSCVG